MTGPYAPPYPHPDGARPPAIPASFVPRHVALVMDGNGRWAKQRDLPRTEGHKRGEHSLFDVIMGAIELGIPYLSAYAFSTENWRRSPDEVRFLMGFNRDVIRRRRDLPVDDEELAILPAIADDPELAHMKDRYRGELRTAITEAIALLATRERLLLKYHYIDGFSIDRIAAIYGIHRATAARWLGAAREALSAQTHHLLISRLGVTPSQLRSIARLVESQLDLSIRRLLD